MPNAASHDSVFSVSFGESRRSEMIFQGRKSAQRANQGDSLLNSNSVPVKGKVDGDSVVIITLANNPSPDGIIASIDRRLAGID